MIRKAKKPFRKPQRFDKMTYVINEEVLTMFLKIRRSLITLLVAIFTAVVALGVALLVPETQAAQAAGSTVLNNSTGSTLDGDYYLAGDVTRTTAINIASGKTVTIDLNGYQLKLSGFSVKISVYGTLTLKDTYTGARTHDITDPETDETVTVVGGVMTGGQSGCISVYSGGTLNMESGAIAGANVTSSSGAGGVSVYDGTFNMSGGTISHNRAGVGGVTVGGTFNMSGGSIVYNTGTSDNNGAGGVFVADGKTFRVEGAVNITNNKLFYNSIKSDNNVCVYTGNKIYVNGKLENETGDKAEIGVTISDETDDDTFVGGVITSGYSSSGNTEKPSAYFTSDYGKCVSIDEGEAKTGAHDIGVADGVCAICQTRMAASVTQAAAPDFYDTLEKAWAAANTAGTATVKMFTDAEAAQTLETEGSKNITFDLNGCMLAIKEGAEGPVISVKGGAAFTLTDTNTDKSKKHTVDNPTTAITTDTVEIVGGVVTGGKGDYGGVYVLSGTFNFNGGTIAGNTARIGGGGVYMQDSGNERGNRGIINMSGSAAIRYNAAQQGGGVLIWGSLGAFNFSGGSIDHNSAYGTGTVDGGGGVYVTNGTFEMTDGAISYNTANCGGGVFILYENFKMSGGTINGNVSSTTGGGVDVRGAFEMTGGAISDNTANNGGGVYCNGSFKAEKLSEITSNTANVYGGGVFNYGTFEIKDAVSVSGNKNGAGESAKADNVYLSPDKKITVTGKLVYGAYNAAIGVNVPSQYSGAFTAGYGASNKFGNGTTVDPNNYFTSDAAVCLVESEGEVEIGNHNYINGVCTRCGDEAPFEVTVDGVKNYYHTIGEAWAAANTAGTATVKMFADATSGATLTVDAGKNITLDLNGRKLTFTNASGRSITVNGKFTLNDSNFTAVNTAISAVDNKSIPVYGGVITRGGTGLNGGISVSGNGAEFYMQKGTVIGFAMLQGGGVSVGSGAKFYMYSGAAVKGCKSSQDGGGVYISGSSSYLAQGELFMQGGEISDNAAGGSGGGVYTVGGFTINGTCTISGNTADGNGGGVFAAKGASFYMGGCPMITGNKKNGAANNVYLDTDALIDMVGEMYVPAQIYVNNTGNAIRGYTFNDESPSEFFRADDSANDCVYISDTDSGVVTIGAHTGGTATCQEKAVCDNCNEEYGEIDANNHSFVNRVCSCGAKEQIYWGVSGGGTDKTLIISPNASDIAGIDISGSFYYDKYFSAIAPWDSEKANITEVDVKEGVAPTSLAFWFCGFGKIKNINLSGFDASDVTNMSYMFQGCSSLTEITFPASFDTSKVTDMSYMFNICSSLTEIDLSLFKTANVTDMKYMFYGCSKLTELDLSSFDTSKVTNMRCMFYNSSSLTKIDLSLFKTANVTDMKYMFYGCSKLTELDLSSFDTSGVGMVDAGGMPTSSMYGMFYGCSGLRTIKTPKAMGAGTADLPAEFWNGTAPVNKMTEANKTLVWHASHTLTTVAKVDKTCTTNGTLAHDHCSVCNKDFIGGVEKTADELKIAAGHTLTSVAQVDKTCTTDGTLAHDNCSVCGKNFISGVEKSESDLKIATTGHSFGDWTEIKAATCTEKGSKKHVCTACGHEETEDIAIDSSAHKWDDGEITTNPTCTAPGVKSWKCLYDEKHTKSEAVPADSTAHSYSTEWTKDETGHWHAATCEHISQKKDFAAHTAGDWIVDTAAQVGVDGHKHKECTVCGYTVETAEIPAIEPGHEHTFSTEWTKDETGHWHAATCVHTDEKSDFAAHTAGEWIIDEEEQIDVAGSKHKECTVCGYTIQTEVIPALTDTLVKPGGNGGENQVVVTTTEGFTQDIELVVTEIAKEYFGAYESVAQTVNGEIGFVYDVTLKSNGVTVQPDGMLTIKLLIPVDLRGKTFNLFHLHESEATDTEYTVDGNYAVVTTDKLSEFIFVGEKTAIAPNDGFNPLWLILIIIVALVIVGEVGYIVYRKVFANKKSGVRE